MNWLDYYGIIAVMGIHTGPERMIMVDRTVGRILSELRIERQQQIAVLINSIVQFFMVTIIEPEI